VLVDMRLCDFIEAVAAKTPTPGGGAVAAAACALGSALGTMAARFSSGPEAVAAAGTLEELKAAFVPLVDQDAEAYNQVSAAFGLPKSNDDEKKRRKEAIQNALKEAAEVPLQVMMSALRALQALAEFAPRCNRNLVSDLASAALMLGAGMEGAAHNVRINAAMIDDKPMKERLESEDRRLSAGAGELRARTLADVEKLQKSGKK